jgi:general secretion pathway protein E
VNGILAQRLVRRLCPHCRQAYRPEPQWLREAGLDVLAGGVDVDLYRPVGCAKCENTGYWGRMTILELLVMTDAVRRVILEQHGADAIRQVALTEGMIPMRIDGYKKALAGLTTVEEVERVTQAADDALV